MHPMVGINGIFVHIKKKKVLIVAFVCYLQLNCYNLYCFNYFADIMNYYQLTTGIDDSDDSDNDNDDGENLAIISGIRRGGGVNQIKLLQPSNPNQEHSSLHQAVNKCLSESTVNDIMKEYDKNSDNHNNNNAGEDVKVKKTQVENLNNNGVVMRRKSSNKGSSYSHRASQR